MEIRKYKGTTEEEARRLVKEELGIDALIVSVKQIKPKGIFRLFRKAYVEITAARDDRTISKELPRINLKADDLLKNQEIIEDTDFNHKGNELDEFKQFIAKYSSKQKEKQIHSAETINSIKKSIDEVDEDKVIDEIKSDKLINKDIFIEEESIEETPTLKLIYNQLLDNEVDEPYVNELMNGMVEYFVNNNPGIDELVSIVYKRVVKNLSDFQVIDTHIKSNPVFFIGPTGVGKTTTIAKIASLHTLIHNRNVALITADTYRIAAVEQLRTYANILGIPIKVIYTKEEMLEALDFFKDKDLVLIDTAGRSHKNKVHQEELCELLDSVQQKDVFLTLSVATKYRDLMKIVNVYKSLCDFKVIFTKLDETLSFGNILNIKMATKAKLSYITFGQNVPDDISEINPHKIARNLLGGEDDGSSE